MKTHIIRLLTLWLILASPALCSVLPTLVPPPSVNGAQVLQPSQWNASIVDVYTWCNTNIVPALNVLTTKGDRYVYNGTTLTRIGVGTNNQVLQADSTQATGMKWATFTGTQAVTTKGDLQALGDGVIQRVPVGANNYALMVDGTQTVGVKWANLADGTTGVFPAGAIIAWSPLAAGTSTIPTGFVVCDGTAGTPNLIGLFVVGTRQPGSSATPAAGGYGVLTVDSGHATDTTHTHTFTPNSANSSGASATQTFVNNTAPPTIIDSHETHYHVLNLSPKVSGSATYEPSDYALIYLMKT